MPRCIAWTPDGQCPTESDLPLCPPHLEPLIPHIDALANQIVTRRLQSRPRGTRPIRLREGQHLTPADTAILAYLRNAA